MTYYSQQYDYTKQTLNAQDEVKFVLASRTDYLWAKQIVEKNAV